MRVVCTCVWETCAPARVCSSAKNVVTQGDVKIRQIVSVTGEEGVGYKKVGKIPFLRKAVIKFVRFEYTAVVSALFSLFQRVVSQFLWYS